MSAFSPERDCCLYLNRQSEPELHCLRARESDVMTTTTLLIRRAKYRDMGFIRHS
jgi:hypothetical protein